MLEAEVFQKNFDQVFNTLDELEAADASVIENLFYYKINHLQEYEQETRELTKLHKSSQMDPNSNSSKFMVKQDAIRRKQMMSKFKGKGKWSLIFRHNCYLEYSNTHIE